jgi:hypothetical protein
MPSVIKAADQNCHVFILSPLFTYNNVVNYNVVNYTHTCLQHNYNVLLVSCLKNDLFYRRMAICVEVEWLMYIYV